MYLVFVFRCKKMLIVLSPDFLKSPECDFQTKFAHALSPGKQQEQGISMLILHSALCRLSPTDIDSTCVSNCWQLATQVSACIPPPPPPAGQSHAYYDRLKMRVGKCDVSPFAQCSMQNSSVYGWQCMLIIITSGGSRIWRKGIPGSFRSLPSTFLKYLAKGGGGVKWAHMNVIVHIKGIVHCVQVAGQQGSEKDWCC